MGFLSYFVLFFVLMLRPAFSAQEKVIGIIIKFRAPLTPTEIQITDELHKKLGLKLDRRLKYRPYDILVPSDPKQIPNCEAYLKLDFVKACHQEVVGHKFDEDCRAGVKVDEDLLKVSGKLDDGYKCLFESEDSDYMVQSEFEETRPLSPLWAQEYIGADLAREMVEDDPEALSTSVAVIDGGFELQALKLPPGEKKWPEQVPQDFHGSNVASLITSDTKVGVAGKASLDWVANFDEPGAFQKLEEDLEINQVKPKIISGSTNWKSADTCEVWERLGARGAIPVAASGNDLEWKSDGLEYPEYKPLALPEDRSNCTSAILVGSLDPSGWQSPFSMEGQQVTISAPSGFFLTASGKKKGKYNSFSGTSGAQPLVAGALANVSSYLPELNLAEAKKLLEKTALPTPNSYEEPRMNGAGMLNAYKLAWVARAIRKKCKRAAEMKSCQGSAINDPKTYAAPEISKDLVSNVKAAFPECAEKKAGGHAMACFDRKKLVTELRKGLLLGAKSRPEWALLACISKSAGFPGNADFYQLMSEVKDQKSLLASFAKLDSEDLAARQVTFLNEDAATYIRKTWTEKPWLMVAINNRLRQCHFRGISAAARKKMILSFMNVSPGDKKKLKDNREADLSYASYDTPGAVLEEILEDSPQMQAEVAHLDEKSLRRVIESLIADGNVVTALCTCSKPLGAMAIPYFEKVLKNKKFAPYEKEVRACMPLR